MKQAIKKYLPRPARIFLKTLPTLLLIIGFILLLDCKNLWAQSFQAGPGVQTNQLLLFVAVKNNCSVSSSAVTCAAEPGTSPVNFGTDAWNPQPNNTSKLYVLVNGQAKLVFPIDGVHNSLVDGPLDSSTYKGAVVDGNVSLNGNKFYFGYYHKIDARHSQMYRSELGSDLYVIDFSTLKANPATDPRTLPVRRLTIQPQNQYGNSYHFAMNQLTAAGPMPNHGVESNGPVEILSKNGQATKLIYSSSMLRLFNSNSSHFQQQLFEADFDANGNLVNTRPFAPLTTTSAISATNARDGIYFSLNYSMRDHRLWRIEQLTSTGLQKPGFGYGIGSFVASHLTTILNTGSGQPENDFLATNAYYPGSVNNNGFGNVFLNPLRDQGINVEQFTTISGQTYRRGWTQKNAYPLFGNINAFEDLGAKCQNGRPVGKVTTPHGAPNGLYLAHGYGAANQRNPVNCNGVQYTADFRSQIIFVPDYSQTIADVTDPTRVQLVIRDTTEQYSLIRPMPLVSLANRLHSAPGYSRDIANKGPLPYGILGTSRLDNTDVRPWNCLEDFKTGFDPVAQKNTGGFFAQFFARGNAYLTNQENHWNFAVQTWKDPLLSHSEMCSGFPIHYSNVGWLGYYLTDNKTDLGNWLAPAGRLETHSLLGVVPAFGHPGRAANDTSVSALVPANYSLTFRLLDRNTGMQLNQATTWHNVRPAEKRVDCGGCHGHTDFNAQNATPFEQTWAGQNPPADLVTQTKYIDYDAGCRPVETVVANPTMSLPVWEDVFPGIVQNCFGCHDSSRSGEPAFVINPNDSAATLSAIKSKNFVEPILGALGSQIFWAARGARSDGQDDRFFRNHINPEFSQYVYDPAHNALPTCNGSSLQKAQWVKKLGDWIDAGAFDQSHFVNGNPNKDRHHPTLAFSLKENTNCTTSQGMEAGVWDDRGQVELIELYKGDFLPANLQQRHQGSASSPLLNGVYAFSLSGIGPTERLTLLVKDAAGNRQIQETNINDLIYRCQVGNNIEPPGGGNGLVNLSLQKTPLSGGIIRLTLTADAPGALSPNAVVLIPGSRTGTGIWNVGPVRLGITYDQVYSDLTLTQVQGPLTNGQAVLNFDVPAILLNPIGTTQVTHQAVVIQDNQVYGLSNPTQLLISQGSTGGGGGNGGGGGAGGSSGESSGNHLRGVVQQPEIGACQAGAGNALDLSMLLLLLLPTWLLYWRGSRIRH